jgi:hypothetical protein
MNALPLHFPLMIFAGWVNRHQQDVIEYQQAENRALREQLGGKRLRFCDQQRRRLAVKAKAVGRNTIKRILLETGFDPGQKKGMSWETFLKAQCGGGNTVSEYCSDRLLQCRSDHSVRLGLIFRSLCYRSQDSQS